MLQTYTEATERRHKVNWFAVVDRVGNFGRNWWIRKQTKVQCPLNDRSSITRRTFHAIDCLVYCAFVIILPCHKRIQSIDRCAAIWSSVDIQKRTSAECDFDVAFVETTRAPHRCWLISDLQIFFSIYFRLQRQWKRLQTEHPIGISWPNSSLAVLPMS